MNILCWNCRGAGSSKFFTNLKDSVHFYKYVLLFLLEHRVLSIIARRIICRFYFTNMVVVKARGFSGRICVCDILPR